VTLCSDATPAILSAATGRDGRSNIAARNSAQIGVAMLGLAAVATECWPDSHAAIRLCLETLFGLSLWAFIIVRHRRHVARTPHMQPCDMRAFSRRLSRRLYCMLYLLVFARQAILLSRLAWRGDTAALHQFQHGSMTAFDHAIFAASRPFPYFLLYGLAALLVINGLAVLWNYRRRTMMAPSPPRMGQV
jgi:hypothetical protein